jgi:hypothetical protein
MILLTYRNIDIKLLPVINAPGILVVQVCYGGVELYYEVDSLSEIVSATAEAKAAIDDLVSQDDDLINNCLSDS